MKGPYGTILSGMQGLGGKEEKGQELVSLHSKKKLENVVPDDARRSKQQHGCFPGPGTPFAGKSGRGTNLNSRSEEYWD